MQVDGIRIAQGAQVREAWGAHHGHRSRVTETLARLKLLPLWADSRWLV
ncbi:hypothetical protein GCM10010508_59820 [Streptomyces naganishii JCM 4654]|uniref:Uncharacterized protein n=1 Tax=Streptomyces naganishii JCM 4654 TaxID=1306179 RepID=A0A918YAT0_9ACTN|nr:hypothetical protein GCM10010508_59820 [Streptomyces naganishii JCM 4654]